MLEMLNFFSARSSRMFQLVQIHLEAKKPRINAFCAVKILIAGMPGVGKKEAKGFWQWKIHYSWSFFARAYIHTQSEWTVKTEWELFQKRQ